MDKPAGTSLVIKGELSSAEDLTFEGRVDGKISLPDHVLTIGQHATVNAEVVARSVVVLGTVSGSVAAKDRFELKTGGSVEGSLKAPKVTMAEGAHFNGKIEMPKRDKPA